MSAQTDSFTVTLQTASQSWQNFSLETKRQSLAQSAAQTKTNHQQTLKSRKVLAETTKAFKKSVKQTESLITKAAAAGGSDGKSKFDNFSAQCKSTVKSYQEEIDNLTKRCKSSDNQFMDLYKGLIDLPDPGPLFSNATEHLNSMNGQVQHLLKGMDEMQQEMARQGSNSNHQIVDLENEIHSNKDEIKELKRQLEISRKATNDATSVNSKNNTQNSLLSKEEKEELISLRSEVAEYEVEFKALKNQDITIKKLNTKIEDLVENQEHELQRELKKTREHLAQTEGRRVTEALEREATMERKLAKLELELKAERAGSQVAQTHLLEADQGQSEREAVWEAQRQILVDDSDRLREVLHEVTRERDTLKMRVEAISGKEDEDDVVGGSGNGDSVESSMVDVVAERKAYEAEVSELTLNVTAMREEIHSKDDTITKLQSSMQATIESLESERGYLFNKVSSLESEIANAPSKEIIDNMRHELRILKKLEYNAVDIDTEKEEPELTSSPTKDGDGDDLESVLIGKLRKVETDLVKERREKSAHYEECEKLREQLVVVEKAKMDADTLVVRLEADLEKAIAVPSTSSDNVKTMTEIPLSTTSDPSTLQHILDPSTPAPAVISPPTAQSNSAAEKRNDDHSVATIVMAQRDRLRARCDGLEAERDGFKRELQIQVQSAESLKADNTKLYEKVRYLQNYNNSSSIGMHARNNASAADRDLDLEALEQRYEASVDPFRQFSRNERQRKMKEMSPMEKTVFVVARTVLGSKEMRTALFFYVLILHLLVFSTTYHWSHGCHAVPNHSASVIDSLHAGIPDVGGPTP